MVLSDRDIARELGYGGLEVEPVDLDEQLQPASLDIRLGDKIEMVLGNGNPIDVSEEDHFTDKISKPTIHPNEFYLANTIETLKIPDYLGCEVRGRSSLARMGIEIHSTAGWVDPGFQGELVLEISNNSRNIIDLEPGMRIGQLVFYELSSPSNNPYNSEDNKYQGQEGAQGSRLHEEL